MSDQDSKGHKWNRGSCCAGHGWGHGHCCSGHGWQRMMSRCCGYGRKKWTKEDELKMLDKEETALKEELEEIQKAKQEVQASKE